MTVVDRPDADVMAAVLGPLVWIQTVVEIVAPLVPAAIPVSVAELVGSVMVWLLPALTIGGVLPAFTVTVSVAAFARPLLSVADN